MSFVDHDDFERLTEGDRVTARIYRGRDIALVHEGRELRTTAHPRYAWGTSLWLGYWFTSFGAFLLWALVATRGRIETLWRSGRRLAKAGPFFIIPGGALLLTAPFDPTATVLAVLTALAAAVTIGGAVWSALRAG